MVVDEIVISLPTKGGGVHDVTPQRLERYRENFPTLDVMAQLRAIRQHLEDQPHKRVPEWSCPTFIANWLNNRIGDKGRQSQAGNNHTGFTKDRYAIDETAKKFEIVGSGS